MAINREKILGLFRDNPGAFRPFRDLMQLLGVTKGQRAKFKAYLDRMVERGELVRQQGNRYGVAVASHGITGRLSVHRDGYGFVTPDDGGEDLFIPARYLREAMHGDLVEAMAAPRGRGGKREGRLMRIVERVHTTIVGRFLTTGDHGVVIPDDQRVTRELIIPPRAESDAKSGQMVVARIINYPTDRSGPTARIVEVLGSSDDPEVEVLTIIRKHDLPYQFPEDVVAEARAVADVVGTDDIAGRVDLREFPTVTIDGETARDFDDAVSVSREGGGKIRLRVSIADVAHYVRAGSALDGEAYLRGTSVYFPDRCIPMLPEELSNGICSLNPQVDRLTLTAEIVFDRSGLPVSTAFYPSIIRSAARLTYTQVKGVLVDKDQELRKQYAHLLDDLTLMEELSLRLTARRRQRGSIDFDLPEPQIVLDLQGQTEAIIKAERNLAHRIIEEFMLAANEAVATHLESQGIPSLYRVHESPDQEKLRDFRDFVFNFGYQLRLGEETVSPAELQKLLDQAEGKPEERMINEVLLRCMKQARYSDENLGHFGLAAPCYTHFTSPIRRYPDLVVHRILKGAIAKTLRKQDLERLAETLPETASHTSKRERVAMEAEREIVELKKVQFMADKVGDEFDGIISGVTSFGLFIELVELFVEGMVHISTLPHDFYRYIEKQHSLVGERSRTTYRIGDQVRVRVASVSMERKQIEFVLAGTESVQSTVKGNGNREEYPRIPVKGKRPRVKKAGGSGEKGGSGGRRRR
ncbi:MAG: ribonuclease R [Geobacter sp.]|nr:MAG: ribonuclease R [Geobacter sp.]